MAVSFRFWMFPKRSDAGPVPAASGSSARARRQVVLAAPQKAGELEVVDAHVGAPGPGVGAQAAGGGVERFAAEHHRIGRRLRDADLAHGEGKRVGGEEGGELEPE